IELLRVTILRIKLFSGFSLNDHMESYITVLAEKGGGVAMVMRGAGDRLNTDTSVSRRDNISLQGTATTTTAAGEAGEGVAKGAVLPRLIDTTAFNLTFLAVTEAAAAP
ncbi:hypothetical protein BDFG_07756, partial [Blastomyces dermatitidis ATCC 26199]